MIIRAHPSLDSVADRAAEPPSGSAPSGSGSPLEMPLGDARTDVDPISEKAPVWVTVVHNDPVTLMDYVVWVFEDYFGMSTARAHDLMLEVHTRDRAVVSRGAREQMEADAGAMHVYGLLATIEEEA